MRDLYARTIMAMEHLGWEYDEASVGFALGESWVSFDQAKLALDAAESGAAYEPKPMLREVAEIVAAGTA